MRNGFEEVRRIPSDDNDDCAPGDERELTMFMGGNGDWYLSVVEPGLKPWHAVRIRTSGGLAAYHPGLVTALADLYRALPGVPKGGEGDR